MYFRPLPRFTAFCVPLLALLIGLGVWQIQRLHWKLGLIAEMNAHLNAPPLSLGAITALPASDAQYRRVTLEGRYENGDETFVYTTGDHGVPVFHVLVPLRLATGHVLIVDRGLIPTGKKNPATRAEGLLEGVQSVTGVWRTPDQPGLFTPPADIAQRVWYARDVAGMARTFGLTLEAPVVVEADSTPVPGGWPRGGQTVVALRNDHLQYAITWFLLAVSLVVVYLAYHRAQGRLGLGRRD